MSENLRRPDLPDLGSVDALLAEHGTDPAEQAALRDLLANAASPARPGELRGEAAALAAFRAAHPASTVPARTRPALTRRLARAMSIKAAVAALTLAGMGGVAVAASTGSLPGPINGPRDKPAKVQPVKPETAPAPVRPSSPDPAAVPPAAGTTAATERAELREQRQAAQRDEHEARQEQLRQRLAEQRQERLERRAERRQEHADKLPQLTARQKLDQSERSAAKANR